MEFNKKLIASFLIAVSIPVTAFAQVANNNSNNNTNTVTTGLQYDQITQSTEWQFIYDQTEHVLVDNSQLKLLVYASTYKYYPENCLVYKIAWNYKYSGTKILYGSIAINDKIVKDKAWTEYSVATDCVYTPGQSYKITFFSGTGGSGKKIYEGSFTASGVDVDNVLKPVVK